MTIPVWPARLPIVRNKTNQLSSHCVVAPIGSHLHLANEAHGLWPSTAFRPAGPSGLCQSIGSDERNRRSEANLSWFGVRLRLRLEFKPLRENLGIALVKRACFPRDGGKISWSQSTKSDHEGRRAGSERSTIGCSDLIRRHRQKANLEEEPSRRARHLAERLDLDLVEKRFSDLSSMWLGESEKAIAAAFEEAADLRAFLILDEADSLLRDRAAAHHSWEITQVNEMLTQMERHPYPFACTTNAPELLDTAAFSTAISSR
jgi:hypothetical protein